VRVRCFPSRVLRAVSSIALLSCFACGGADVGSIGAILARDAESGRVLVEEAPEGLAASTAGIERGDELIVVDGVQVTELTPDELRHKLRGEVGSEVKVTLARGDRILRLSLKRTPLGKPAPTAAPTVEKIAE
jgi:C-terminal processing protease CtpA/Prc